MATKSNRSRRAGKPAEVPPKPYDGVPLFAHQTRRWRKKINQMMYFFGRLGHKDGDHVVAVDDVAASAAQAKKEFDRQWPYSLGRTRTTRAQ